MSSETLTKLGSVYLGAGYFIVLLTGPFVLDSAAKPNFRQLLLILCAQFPAQLRLYCRAMAESLDVGKGNRLTGNRDEELVLAAMGGDVDSFLTLSQRYYPAMVAVARAVLGDGHLCEDAAQEAFAKACRRLNSLKSPSNFGAWLTAICRNEARSMLRQTPKTESLGDRDVPEKIFEQNPDVDLVLQAIKRLPVDARELLYLKYRNELSYEAIAELLDTTPQAVHGRLQRTRQSVKTYVERQRNRRLS